MTRYVMPFVLFTLLGGLLGVVLATVTYLAACLFGLADVHEPPSLVWLRWSVVLGVVCAWIALAEIACEGRR